MTREIYLVRHAIAEERGDAWPDDTKRPLTRDGAERMKRITRGLRAIDMRVDVILTSPLVRAVQTAEILSDGLEAHPGVLRVQALAPGNSPARVAGALAAHRKSRAIAVVGHEPGLGELAAWLIGAKQPVPFKKGGVARIDIDTWPPDASGRLVWHATPRLLRKLKP